MWRALRNVVENLQQQAFARWKWLRSFRKESWEVDDYPLQFRYWAPGDLPDELVGWEARIINWWLMTGRGVTIESARGNLSDELNAQRAAGLSMPRPGTVVPIEFAPSDRVARHEELADDFFARILGLDYRYVGISDESSMWVFPHEDGVDLEAKVRFVYGVDVSDLGGNLADIFDRIEAYVSGAGTR